MGEAFKNGGAALLSVFDHIYVVNLPSRTDRRREMEHQLQGIGLSLDHPRITLFAAIRPESKGEFPSIGCRGCFESHLAIFKAAVEANHSSILIIEDDTNFRANFAQRFGAMTPRLATEPWDIFYGWTRQTVGKEFDAQSTEMIEMDPSEAPYSSHFIGYQKSAIVALVPYLSAIAARPLGDPNGGPMHIDGAYGWFRAAHPTMKTLASLYPITRQRPSRTDIQDVRWFDRIAVLAPLVLFYRRLKSQFRQE